MQSKGLAAAAPAAATQPEDKAAAAAPNAAAAAGAGATIEGKAMPPMPPLPGEEPSGFAAALPRAQRSTINKWDLAKPGRIILRVLEGREIYKPGRRGQSAKIDPYIKVEVGRGKKKSLKLKAEPKTNQGSNPDMGPRRLNLDLPEPKALAVDDDLKLHFEVWDKNVFADEKLGEGSVSLIPFFRARKQSVERWFPLTMPAAGGGDGIGSSAVSAGELLLSFKFEEARRGMLVVTLHEGIDLPNREVFGEQDPYGKVTLGNQTARTATVRNGGRNPLFNDEEMEVWIDKTSWAAPLQLQLLDEDVGRDDFIGGADLSVLPFIQDNKQRTVAVPLVANGRDAGEARASFKFYPAGRLRVQLVEGRRLSEVDAIGQQDPYVRVTIEGSCRSYKQTTKVDVDGGADPVWNETMAFDIVDQHHMLVEVMDKDMLSSDDLIGAVSIPLLPIFKSGIRDSWVGLKVRTTWGKLESRGEIMLKVDFEGPKGVAFPQRQPDLDSFDERERRHRDGTVGGKRPFQGAHADEPAKPPQHPSDFSDDQIEEAFRFVDLDKNLVIGAAEIRHILVCMGELITAEEVDEMIAMIDKDGDGMISFDEFAAMARHPDPASAEFAAQLARGETKAAKSGPRRMQAGVAGRAGGGGGVGGGAPPPPGMEGVEVGGGPEAAGQAQAKAAKKHFCKRFVDDNHLRLHDLQRAYRRLLSSEQASARDGGVQVNPGSEVEFEGMCELFEAEPTGEARALFNCFVRDSGLVSFRELLLSLCNFCGTDKNQRINFCFFLFDADQSGELDEVELVEIIKSTSLHSDEAQARRKAAIVLRAADKDGNNTVSLEEFVIAANKFPSLLFPQY